MEAKLSSKKSALEKDIHIRLKSKAWSQDLGRSIEGRFQREKLRKNVFLCIIFIVGFSLFGILALKERAGKNLSTVEIYDIWLDEDEAEKILYAILPTDYGFSGK